jgi:hypothetical protein
MVIPGIVHHGFVVPQYDTSPPDGAYVAILIRPAAVTPALQVEFDQSEQASDEAWAMIDRWKWKISDRRRYSLGPTASR